MFDVHSCTRPSSHHQYRRALEALEAGVAERGGEAGELGGVGGEGDVLEAEGGDEGDERDDLGVDEGLAASEADAADAVTEPADDILMRDEASASLGRALFEATRNKSTAAAAAVSEVEKCLQRCDSVQSVHRVQIHYTEFDER